jgi:two-component sensor histidine kinase
MRYPTRVSEFDHRRLQVPLSPLGIYLEDVCRDLDDAVAICNIEINAEHGIEIMTDRAIPIALITNELITNAAKHAHADGQSGTIYVRLARRDEMVELTTAE